MVNLHAYKHCTSVAFSCNTYDKPILITLYTGLREVELLPG